MTQSEIPGPQPRRSRPFQFGLLAESFRSGTYWAEPDDLELESIPLAINPGSSLRGIRGAERERVIVGLADGSAIALPATLDSELLQCLLTRDGGEVIDWTGLRP
ncbi:MAG: hypothetical protein J5I93_04890 [Pirellulaceae bacterium]|nr:hypothetical protein [Pirellulaceae bacterium]